MACVCLYLKPRLPGGRRTEECVITWGKSIVDHCCWEAKAQEANVCKYAFTARAHQPPQSKSGKIHAVAALSASTTFSLESRLKLQNKLSRVFFTPTFDLAELCQGPDYGELIYNQGSILKMSVSFQSLKASLILVFFPTDFILNYFYNNNNIPTCFSICQAPMMAGHNTMIPRDERTFYYLKLQKKTGCHTGPHRATQGIAPRKRVTSSWNCRKQLIYGKQSGVS